MKRDVAARIISKPDVAGLTPPIPLPGLGQGAKVLIVSSGCRAALFRKLVPDATVITEIDALESIETRFDAAVIDGPLESDPWDRWALQCVHRVLNINAPVAVVVSPITSLVSAADFRFFAYASRTLLQQLLRRLRPGVKLPGAVHRRYHLPRLVKKMESLGYTAIEAGPGWPESARIKPSAWFARRSIVTARKACSIAGFHGRRWPDAHEHRRRYAEQWARLFAAREKWLSAFPGFRVITPSALEPSEWRDARVLVLSPHPDDELIGCGGTLCRVLSAGAQVWILQATDGCKLASLRDLPEALRKTVRLEEAGRVASALGAGLVLWRQEDAGLQCSSGTIAELARSLDDLKPTHVFTPFLTDLHADHRTLSQILGEALAVADLEPQVLQYEVWGLVPANLYCDITDRAETLERLLLLYKRAMRADDFVHFCESRNLARSLELTGQPGYVEAFLSTTSAEYRRLVERTASTRTRAQYSSSALVAGTDVSNTTP
jgi:LmbE family N-acetylglucosaminyl deacetylase